MFCASLCSSLEVQRLLKSTIDHPFNQALAEGTLERAKFEFYLKQDSLYLVDFARALAITGSKLPRASELELLLGFAQGALVAERSLHESFFRLYGIQANGVEFSPSCRAYVEFLLATAHQQDAAVSMAALLPCFWVYREVGRALEARTARNNPYQAWIDTYAGTAFDAVVSKAVGITDELAERSSSAGRDEMAKAFLQSCRFEWMFWEAAERLESWPTDSVLGAKSMGR